jgi:hypothetical protein
MREHTHLSAMVGLVSQHVAEHFRANRPGLRPAVSEKLLDAGLIFRLTTTAERFGEHLRAASGAFGQAGAGLLRRAVRAAELGRNFQVRRGKPDPLAADIVHMGEDRRDVADVVARLAGRSGCRLRGRFPRGKVKMFDEKLVHALIGGKDPDCGPAESSIDHRLTDVELMSFGWSSFGWSSFGLTNPGLTNPGLPNLGLTDLGLRRGHGCSSVLELQYLPS